MSDLAAWLLEQIAADERIADDAEHVAHWHPARILVECAAKRAIVGHVKEQWDVAYGVADLFLPHEWETVLRLLALPYADRPGWRQEWVL